MGFMATYWGYTSMREVESYMYEFRSRKLPIDSFIMDYDWFGPNPCGEVRGLQTLRFLSTRSRIVLG